MADANQFKIEARRKEASGDYAAASQLYQRALAAMEEGNSLPDPSLLVRVADLEYRQNKAGSALSYYHRAVEDYAEQGLITNAIAVCNKILRVFPEEISCYRLLADLHMDVGLVAEARQNLLRFVDRAWDEGKTDAAIEAMEELLARSPDQEIALKLATSLARLDRTDDALEVLARVWRERTKADADVEGLERKARELDPEVDLDGWLPAPEPEDEEVGMAGAESFASGGPVAAEQGEGAPEEAVPDASAPEEPAGEAAPDRSPAPSPLDELAAAADGLAGIGDETAEEPAEEPAGEPAEQTVDEPAEESPAKSWEPMSYGRLDEGRLEEAVGGEPVSSASRLRGAGAEPPELELVASFPDWFSEMATGRPEMATGRPTNGESPGATVQHAAGTGPGTSTEDRAGTRPDGEVRIEARSGTGDRTGTRPDSEDRIGTRSGSEDREEERVTDEPEELQELEASAELATAAGDAGSGATERPAAPGGEDPRAGTGSVNGRAGGGSTGEHRGGTGPDAGPSGGGPDGGAARRAPDAGPSGWEPDGATARRESDAGDALGEEQELRRGLALLDDLLEVDPDNTELKERKVRYARRLGDPEVLVDAFLDLADSMAEEGSRRGARLLYEKVLELDAGNQRAEGGLGRLDRAELEQKRQTGKRAGAAASTPRDPSPEEKEARRHLGMRLWTEFEKAVQEMPWLHAATQTYQATSPEAAPPVEAFEMLAHYLISRDRCREAADILEQAVKVADRSDDEVADALYYLGLAHERLGEGEKAAGYFRRLAEVDPAFASVRKWLPGEERADG